MPRGKKKPQIQIDAEQARHYWSRAATAVQINEEQTSTVLEDISRSMDGETKKKVSRKKTEVAYIPERVSHEETIQTFVRSWFLQEYVFRARYAEKPLLLDLYPHRLDWGYSWELLDERPAIPGFGHLYITVPMCDEDVFISTWNAIKEDIEQEYPGEPKLAGWILNRVFARFPKESPLFDRERKLILEDFTYKYALGEKSDRGTDC